MRAQIDSKGNVMILHHEESAFSAMNRALNFFEADSARDPEETEKERLKFTVLRNPSALTFELKPLRGFNSTDVVQQLREKAIISPKSGAALYNASKPLLKLDPKTAAAPALSGPCVTQ